MHAAVATLSAAAAAAAADAYLPPRVLYKAEVTRRRVGVTGDASAASPFSRCLVTHHRAEHARLCSEQSRLTSLAPTAGLAMWHH